MKHHPLNIHAPKTQGKKRFVVSYRTGVCSSHYDLTLDEVLEVVHQVGDGLVYDWTFESYGPLVGEVKQGKIHKLEQV